MNLFKLIKEEYNNIIKENDKQDIIDILLDRINNNIKLNYLENKLLKILSKSENISTYNEILFKFLDSLNLEYYEEKINSFGKEINVEYLLDTKTNDINLVFSLEENKTTVYILYKYYKQLFNIFKDFIDENSFDNILIEWCRKNINNRINKISLSFDNESNINESDYRGEHQAPERTSDVSSPLYDVRKTLGNDFYQHSSKELARYYGSGHSYDQILASIILQYKDKPNKIIEIYRAIPDFNKEYKDKIKNLQNIISYYNKFNFYPPRNKYKKYADIVDEYENIIKNENNSIEYNELKNEIYNRIINEISTLDSKKQKYKIEKGDWVTIIKQYAIEHGKTQFDNYIILTKTVKANELFTEGYMEEWGYDPISNDNTTTVIKENDKENEEDIQALIDIIDINPNSPRMDMYKNNLEKKYNYEYINPEIRYKEDIKIVNNLINKKYTTSTNKGLNFYFITIPAENLIRTVQIEIYNMNNDFIGKVGFNINTTEKSIIIGGAEVKEKYRRKGIYSKIVDYIENVANKYNLNIVEGSRSSDARAFWNNRNNNN
jgi:hypothetical protein